MLVKQKMQFLAHLLLLANNLLILEKLTV